MLKRTNHRSPASNQLARITDEDLGAVVGGMFRQPQGGQPGGITFPPLPSIPQTSYRVAMPPAPSPFSVSTFSSGGTGQSPQHVVGASFDNGRLFASAQVFTPAVPAIPPLPRIDGTFTPALQTYEVKAGVRFRF